MLLSNSLDYQVFLKRRAHAQAPMPAKASDRLLKPIADTLAESADTIRESAVSQTDSRLRNLFANCLLSTPPPSRDLIESRVFA